MPGFSYTYCLCQCKLPYIIVFLCTLTLWKSLNTSVNQTKITIQNNVFLQTIFYYFFLGPIPQNCLCKNTNSLTGTLADIHSWKTLNGELDKIIRKTQCLQTQWKCGNFVSSSTALFFSAGVSNTRPVNEEIKSYLTVFL